MKREIPISKILAIAALVMISGIGNIARAESQNQHSGIESSLLTPIQNLADAIQDLVKVIAGATGQNYKEQLSEDMSLEAHSSFMLPSCLSGITEDQASYTYTSETGWAANLLMSPYATASLNVSREEFFDINGDGLIDYMYFKKARTSVYEGSSRIAYYDAPQVCILLNTGSGWEIGYRCSAGFDKDAMLPIYYGDCADMTP